jgi:hypothetical protein
MEVRRPRRRNCVEATCHGIGDFRVRRIDPRIDDGDDNLFAGRDTVRLRKMKLARRVGNACIGPNAAGRWRRLCQREPIIGLRGAHDPIGLQRADDIGDAAAVGDAPAVIGRPDQRDLLRLDGRQPMPAREIVERARGDIGGEPDHDLARHKAPLTGRRDAAAVARVGVLRLTGDRSDLAGRGSDWSEHRIRCPGNRVGDGTHQGIGGGIERRRAGDGRRNGALGAIDRTDRIAWRRRALKGDGDARRRQAAGTSEVGSAQTRSAEARSTDGRRHAAECRPATEPADRAADTWSSAAEPAQLRPGRRRSKTMQSNRRQQNADGPHHIDGAVQTAPHCENLTQSPAPISGIKDKILIDLSQDCGSRFCRRREKAVADRDAVKDANGMGEPLRERSWRDQSSR